MLLPISHISKAVNTAISYIEGRKDGSIKSLQTSFKKLNNALLDGIEWNKIFTVGGMSGSGKSILCEQLKRDIMNLNNEKIKVLSFEYEMPSYEQVARNLSGSLNVSVRDLYSAEEKVSDELFKKAKAVSSKICREEIYTVDDVGDVDDMIETIIHFINSNEDIIKGETGLLVTVDHVLLTKGKQGQTEREILAYLYRSIVGLRKKIVSQGIKVLFIFLSQLNRDIETLERKGNPEYHYPNRNDLFGSNDIFMGSDYVLVIHKPYILNIQSYGLKKYPVVNIKTGSPYIYFHILKNRTGEPTILLMEENFKYSKIIDAEVLHTQN